MAKLEHRYLRPGDLARLRHLTFQPRRRVEGRYAGAHASPQQGRSVEFNDYRPYMPGDEVADIDWKVYARTDRLYLKRFEQQTQMSVHLLLDASASMAYRGELGGASGASASQPAQESAPTIARRLARKGRGRSEKLGSEPDAKYDHAARMAAAIAFMLTQQQDAVSLGLARDGLAHFLPPGRTHRHLLSILGSLEQFEPGDDASGTGVADVAGALEAMQPRMPRRGLLIVFSDLLEYPDAILRALAAHLGRGGEAIVFHVLHPDELELPDLDAAEFIDSETRERMRINVGDVRQAYQQRIHAWLDEWSTGLRRRGVDYQRVPTATDYTRALERHLAQRAAG